MRAGEKEEKGKGEKDRGVWREERVDGWYVGIKGEEGEEDGEPESQGGIDMSGERFKERREEERSSCVGEEGSGMILRWI